MPSAHTRTGRKKPGAILLAGSLGIGLSLIGGANSHADDTSSLGLGSSDSIYEAEPGAPRDAPDIYYTLRVTLFHEEPEAWGGAYVDGDDLVINYVDGVLSAEEALSKLAVQGIAPGEDAVRVEPAEHSIADLLEAQAELMDSREPWIVAVSPQYSANRLAVGVDEEVAASLGMDSSEAVLNTIDAASTELSPSTSAADSSNASGDVEFVVSECNRRADKSVLVLHAGVRG